MRMKMKNKLLAILFASLFAVCALLGVSLINRNEKATAATAEVTLKIQSNNLSYADSVYLLYAVSGEGVDYTVDTVKMLFWESAKPTQEEYLLGTESYAAENSGRATVGGKDCLVFYSKGIAAKEMTDEIYARAYVEVGGVGYYSELKKCSVLEYVYGMREKGGLTSAQTKAFDAMLAYGAAMQTLLGYHTDRLATATYYQISVVNGTLFDGTTAGRYLLNEKVTLTPSPAPEGKKFVGWVDGLGDSVEGNEITVTESQTYTAVYEDIAPSEPSEPTVQEKTVSWTAGTHTGTQYANDTFTVSEDLTISSHNKGCHFTSELRIYDSTKYQGWAIMKYSGAVGSLAFNMGYKTASLLVYGSTDGTTWESVGTIAVTTAYKDYALDVDETKGYTYIKIDPSGEQIRVKSIQATIFVSGEKPTTPPAEEEEPVTPPAVEYTDELQMYFPSFQNKVSGDCTLIKVGNTEVLIDAGSTSGSADVIVPYIAQYCTDGILEYVIATHAHEDHIAAFVGTSGVFASFACQTIIDFAKTNSTSQVYNSYVSYRDAEVSAGATHYTALECWKETNGAKKSYTLGGGITLNILYQDYYEQSTGNENNYSVCTMISYGEKHFLFTGDLEAAGEASLLANNNLPVCELFKSGHHGSNTANSSALLAKIQPKKMIITCCCGDKHGFPHQETIDTIALYTAEVYVPTMATEEGYALLNGNITVVCNGIATTVTGSNNSILFKDTDWFKANRVTPINWK